MPPIRRQAEANRIAELERLSNLRVSIVILNYNHPHNITRLLPSLKLTSGITYETIVVDNGSSPDVVAVLHYLKDQRFIDNLVLSPVNTFFSEGCNIGVRESLPGTEFILLLNNDTQILNGMWLSRMIEWAEGIPKTFLPYTWSDYPTYPKDIKRGIVSIDWGYDLNVPGYVRPEGWCCLIRREAWREMSPDFPMTMGDMEMMASVVRDGYPCGCLSQYGKYITHFVGGSRKSTSSPVSEGEPVTNVPEPKPTRQADMRTWWSGLECESLDFTLGPNERRSYMEW